MDNSDNAILRHVRFYYERIYRERQIPSVKVPAGVEFAVSLGYPERFVYKVSKADINWEKVFPCGCPLKDISLSDGVLILNVGSGIGLDAFFAEWKAGLQGQCPVTINVDVVPEVLIEGNQLAERLNATGIFWVCANGAKLPFRDNVFDLILMNGVFNIFPNKNTILREVYRVLKNDGILCLADLFVSKSLPPYFLKEMDAWAWCMSGAMTPDSVMNTFTNCGFQDTRFSHLVWLDKEKLFARGVVYSRKSDSSTI